MGRLRNGLSQCLRAKGFIFRSYVKKWNSSPISHAGYASARWAVYHRKVWIAKRLSNHKRDKTCQEKGKQLFISFGKCLEAALWKDRRHCQTGNKPDRAIWKGQRVRLLPRSANRPVFEARVFFIEVWRCLQRSPLGQKTERDAINFRPMPKSPLWKVGFQETGK